MASVVALAACRGPAPDGRPGTVPPAQSTATTAPAATTAPVPTTGAPAPGSRAVTVAYRVERRVDDRATEGFESFVEQTLTDPRGWRRAGFDLVRGDDAPHVVVLAEGDEVDRLCLPYDTYGLYSCQNGPVVALNADRWRSATAKWTGDLETYRAMLVNHEVGHLLGQRHPPVNCPARGRPAPVMAQQSTELNGCLPNPWPLPSEIDRAARHDLPIAPPFSRGKG